MYKWNDKKERIITSAIVIDGAFEIKDEALNFLYSHTFSGRYKNVTFVPYKSNEVFKPSDQIGFIKSNNEYQQKLARLIIKANEASTKHTINGRTFSFQDWLQNITVDKKHVIEGVEIAPDDVLRIIFHIDITDAVKHVVHNLYDYAEPIFGENLTASILDRENLQRTKTSHEVEKEHAKKLKAKAVNANPQTAGDTSTYSRPHQPKARGYYGTYLELSKTNQTQTSEITNDTFNEDDGLRKQVRDIANAQKSLETTMNTTISTVVSTHIQPIQTQINNIQITHQAQINGFMTMMRTMATGTDKRLDAIQTSLSQLGVPAETPSEANTSPPGVGS